jgi:hypothetical protein
MKRAALFFIALLATLPANAKKYDAFTAEAKKGLDYVAVKYKGDSADGDLGRTVYTEKVREDYDIFIPTTNYVRLGVAANIGLVSTSLVLNGEDKKYDFGLAENLGIGWNLYSFIRTEIDWGHSYVRYDGGSANFDMLRTRIYFDLMRRYVLSGDVYYRRRIVPYIGVGGGAGWADFGNSGNGQGHDSLAYGGNAELGISFAFSDTNAIDLAAGYEYLFGSGFGWISPSKNFRNATVSLSWRSSF